MTLIIGARCKDGVVIVGDLKVVEGTHITTEEKITQLTPDIYVGGAGVREIIDKFNERIPSVLEERRALNLDKMKEKYPNVNVEDLNAPAYYRAHHFLDDCEDLLSKLSQRYMVENDNLHSDILVAINVNGDAELHHLDTRSCLNSKRRAFRCIGSGSPYAKFILKGIWDKELTMKQVAKLSKFIIVEIEKLGIDNNVGQGVQIEFIPDQSNDTIKLIKDIEKWKDELHTQNVSRKADPNDNLDGELDRFFDRIKKKLKGKSI